METNNEVLETSRWVKENLKLRTGKASYSRHDSGAFERGKRDGAKINMGGGAALGSGNGPRRQLRG